MIFHDVDVKSEVRYPKQLTSCNKNIASARPDVCEERGKCEGNGAPNTNSSHNITHPKNGFSKGETTKMYGNCESQYGGNRSRRLDSHHDDEIEMTNNAKK